MMKALGGSKFVVFFNCFVKLRQQGKVICFRSITTAMHAPFYCHKHIKKFPFQFFIITDDEGQHLSPTNSLQPFNPHFPNDKVRTTRPSSAVSTTYRRMLRTGEHREATYGMYVHMFVHGYTRTLCMVKRL